METTTEDELEGLAKAIAIEISAKRDDMVDVYITRRRDKCSFHLGRWGADEIVKGKNAADLSELGHAFLDGLRFQ